MNESGRIPDNDWIAAGFRYWPNNGGFGSHAGLWQARIRDGRGTAYFVNVRVYDWREFGDRYPAWSYSSEDQFTRGERTFNVSSLVDSSEHALSWAAEVWAKLECDHYEAEAPHTAGTGTADLRRDDG